MLSTWSVLAVGLGVLGAAVVSGLWLWWPSHGEADSRTDLGAALMTGTIVAFAVLGVQVLFELRVERLEDQRRHAQAARDAILRHEAERRGLSLTIGLRRDLREIDLRHQDLRGFYFARKNLRGGQLVRARLEHAVLWAADLSNADLRGARLQGATLDDAQLNEAMLTGANLHGASLRNVGLQGADLSQADLRDADLAGANLTGAALGGAQLARATYNASTTWPASVAVPRCRRSVCSVAKWASAY